MASAQVERINTNCKIIWGGGDYDLEAETDDYVTYVYFVRRDFGSHFGPPLTCTGACNSQDKAWRELDRMLDIWAKQKQSGQPMTKAQRLEIFGGPNGRYQPILKKFIDELEKRGLDM